MCMYEYICMCTVENTYKMQRYTFDLIRVLTKTYVFVVCNSAITKYHEISKVLAETKAQESIPQPSATKCFAV